jgi:hypothetical protein
VAPVVVVIRPEEGARLRSLPLFNLPQKMFAVQTHLIFRRPKLCQPKPEGESDDRSAAETVLKDGRHGLVSYGQNNPGRERDNSFDGQ